MSIYNNPYQQYQMPQYQQSYAQRTEIIHVNGENGARAMQLAPNSNALLLDDTAPIVWLVQTDGAGYKTVTPYSITPYKPAQTVDASSLASLEERIKRLEEALNEQSNSSAIRKKSDDK